MTARSSEIKVAPEQDPELNIATGQSRTETHWHNETYSWSQLLERLNHPTVTQETHKEFMGWSKAKRDACKDVGGFVGGWLKAGKRKSGNVQNRSLISLDVDFADHNLWEDIGLIFTETIAVYSTHSYSIDHPRIRLLIPLTRPVTVEEYEPVARKLAERLGMDNFDDTTYQPERLMYWPSHSRDGAYFFEYQEADLLNPDKLLDEYENWHDSSFWPVSSRVTDVHQRDAKKQGDPLTKTGYIGAFNRAYTIPAVIDKYLSEIYSPSDHENRYTYTLGTTSGGLVLYDDVFAYSHHSTDPVGDTLRNAFDLVRIHKFGDLDEDVKPSISESNLPSFKAMVALIQKDKLVMREMQAEALGSAQEDFKDEDGQEHLKPWVTFSSGGLPSINHNELARAICEEVPVYYGKGLFLHYDKTTGLWEDETEDYLKKMIALKRYAGDLSSIKVLNEVITAIKAQQYTSKVFPEPDTDKLVLKNGIYSISNNQFTNQFSKDIHARVSHPVMYDPKATAETFKAYVSWLVGKDNAPFIFEWFGYCFFQGYPVQKMLFLYGAGGTGKSTLIKLLKDLVGTKAYASVPLEAMIKNEFALSGLQYKTANFDADAKPEYLRDGSTLKTLTGEDTIHADVKYKTPVQFLSHAKLTFATNQLPAMRDFSGGLKRRMIIVKTPRPVTKEIKDKYPLEKMQEELPGIFNLAMDGLRNVIKNNAFTITDSMNEELQTWLSQNDPVRRFVDEATTSAEDSYTTAEDMYNAYSQYAFEGGEAKLSRIKFYQRMEQLGYPTVRKRIDKKPARVIQSIQLLEEYEL